jgi:hypothetical protein
MAASLPSPRRPVGVTAARAAAAPGLTLERGSVEVEQHDFAVKLQRALGIEPTALSTLKIWAWLRQEGGNWNNSAKYNPLNTTLPMPGAGNTGAQGNIKVYRSWQQGIEATASTLHSSAYAGIIANLKSGASLESFEATVDASPWGTHFPGEGKAGTGGTSSTGAPATGGELFPGTKPKVGGVLGPLIEFLEGAVGEVGKKLFHGATMVVLLVAGAVLIVYGIMVAVRPRETAFGLPRVIPMPGSP